MPIENTVARIFREAGAVVHRNQKLGSPIGTDYVRKISGHPNHKLRVMCHRLELLTQVRTSETYANLWLTHDYPMNYKLEPQKPVLTYDYPMTNL